MGTDPLKGLQDSTDDKSFTEYLKTRKMQTLLSSAQSGCQKSAAEVLMVWWQKREKAGGWIGNSKTDGDWSATGRWQISQCATKGDVRERHRDTPGSRRNLCSWETQRAGSLRCRLHGPATQLAHLDSPMPSEAEGGWAIIPGVNHLLGTVLYLYLGHLLWHCPKSVEVESNIILTLQQRKQSLWVIHWLHSKQEAERGLRPTCPKAQAVRSQSSADSVTNKIPKSLNESAGERVISLKSQILS